jgi:hemerythrin-like domain-containing protein
MVMSPNALPADAFWFFSNDHLTLQRGLAVLGAMREGVRNRRPPQTASLLTLIDFFRGFGDGCHHAKEDQFLLPEMKAAGILRPTGSVVDDHHRLRDLMTTLEASIPSLTVSPESRRKFLDASGAYGDALVAHLQYEDSTIVPTATFELGPDRIARVLAGCAAHDRNPEHTGAHTRYVAALDRLAQQCLGAQMSAQPPSSALR